MNDLINVSFYDGAGVGGIVNSETYSILLLNYLPRLAPAELDEMQRHFETDESFILLQGEAVLFSASGRDRPEMIKAVEMKMGTIYTVPKGVWHTQAMTENAKILLVENIGTCEENSQRIKLPQEQRQQIFEACDCIK